MDTRRAHILARVPLYAHACMHTRACEGARACAHACECYMLISLIKKQTKTTRSVLCFIVNNGLALKRTVCFLRQWIIGSEVGRFGLFYWGYTARISRRMLSKGS